MTIQVEQAFSCILRKSGADLEGINLFDIKKTSNAEAREIPRLRFSLYTLSHETVPIYLKLSIPIGYFFWSILTDSSRGVLVNNKHNLKIINIYFDETFLLICLYWASCWVSYVPLGIYDGKRQVCLKKDTKNEIYQTLYMYIGLCSDCVILPSGCYKTFWNSQKLIKQKASLPMPEVEQHLKYKVAQSSTGDCFIR